MKTALILFAFVLLSDPSSAPAPQFEGQICWKDSDCAGYNEICYKSNSWDPNGRCIKGSR